MVGFGTRAVRSGSPRDESTGALVEPICLSTTFAQDEVASPRGQYVYSRSGNPNRKSFETTLAELEGAKHALAFSSGLAAVGAIVQGLAADSHIICMAGLYGGTHRYLTQIAPSFRCRVTFTRDIESELPSTLNHSEGKTSLVWIETPSNPTLSLVDIQAVAETAHNKGVLVVVDNTFLSPYIQNPLKHGADIVLHSVTKYINGHSDVLMGAIALHDPSIYLTLVFLQNAAGSVPSPFDCWLAHRGVKTLHLRARIASQNAAVIAQVLEDSPHVLAVHYPGSSRHPQRETAVRQHRDGLGGGMVSFLIRGGNKAAKKFCETSQLFTLAESLGGVESLCELPAAMTHNGMPKTVREENGVYDNLIRLSIGIEDLEDLKADLVHALERSSL
ncbi:Cys/Met metabolism PLP-dependent enzyme-domain-containing protein [Aspergillus tetrazonus]